MKIRKWLIPACLLAAVACPGLAGAADNPEFTVPGAGIVLRLPEEFDDLKGTVIPSGPAQVAEGIYETDLLYVAAGEGGAGTEETASESAVGLILCILSADDGQDFDAINAVAGGSLDETKARVIGQAGDTTHFLYDTGADTLDGEADAPFEEEYAGLVRAREEIAQLSAFGEITDPYDAVIGKRLSFETTDLDGNPVTSEEIFSAHEITMVNIWTSWCTYCIAEMEELEAISRRLGEIDCAVVGILEDGTQPDALGKGKEILRENGVTYLNILPPDQLSGMLYYDAYPTTYFVDRDGIVTGKPVRGARTDQYEETVRTLWEEKNR